MTKNKIILISIIAAVVIAAGIGTYLLVANKNDQPLSSSVEKNTCKTMGGDDTLCSFFAASKDIFKNSYVISVTTAESTSIIEYDGKGNSRMSDAAQGTGFVVLDDTTYIKSENVWLRMPKNDQGETSQLPSPEETYKSLAESLSSEDTDTQLSFEPLGTKQHDGRILTGYTVYADTQKTEGAQYWFDTKEQRLYQLIQGEGDEKTTMDFSYRTVVITEPSPVQPFGI